MEWLQAFLDHPQAELVMLLVGGAMCMVGLIQVVRKGLSLILWLALFTIGLIPLTYVLSGSDSSFLNTARNVVTEAGSSAPGITNDVLRNWCGKLEEVCR